MVGDRVTAHSKRKLPYLFHFYPDPTFRSAVGLPGGEVFTNAQFDRLKVDNFLPGYGHDNKRAADLEGTKLAMDAGYSPERAVRLLRTFLVLSQQMPNALEVEERIELIQPLVHSANQAKERPLKLLP
jgi:hypothetical protein